jgi:hypothetical protein
MSLGHDLCSRYLGASLVPSPLLHKLLLQVMLDYVRPISFLKSSILICRDNAYIPGFIRLVSSKPESETLTSKVVPGESEELSCVDLR